jgi:glutathione S-transferase
MSYHLSALSWAELATLTNYQLDTVNGSTNPQSRIRLFDRSGSLENSLGESLNESLNESVRVVLYRDNHAWCPYCQKVWLWLEEMRIPYQIKKVTMFCYGEKESWYKKIVPSGMLPALSLDGKIITESDHILIALEQAFGNLYRSMEDPTVIPLRRLERILFRAWCEWLCRPFISDRQDQNSKQEFLKAVAMVEEALGRTSGAYFLEDFSVVDLVFTPFVERMNASLFYYKGYSLREENPGFSKWFDEMESRITYRGTQSDFHTHVHDLPPQMGGCHQNREPQTAINQSLVNNGPWFGLPDATYPEPANSRNEALYRVVKHHEQIIRANPADDRLIDQALRCALTNMISKEVCIPPAGSDIALRYLRDRVNVPRDMSIYAAKRFREALETTAALAGDRSSPALPTSHRRDQDPAIFFKA